MSKTIIEQQLLLLLLLFFVAILGVVVVVLIIIIIIIIMDMSVPELFPKSGKDLLLVGMGQLVTIEMQHGRFRHDGSLGKGTGRKGTQLWLLLLLWQYHCGWTSPNPIHTHPQ